MKIERLTDNKIRIIMSVEELSKENVDFLSLTQNTFDAQKLFSKILSRAEKEVGFIVEDCKVLIEAFFSSDEFFIITFTKISPETSMQIGSPIKLKIKKSVKYNNFIYIFNTFDDFSDFCTYISTYDIDYRKLAKGITFYKYNDQYYLVFSCINRDFVKADLFFSLISEFAVLASHSSVLVGKVVEYGNTIFKNNALSLGIKYLC